MLTVTVPRFFLALAIGMVVQATVLTVYYDDLLYLRRGAAGLADDDATTFAAMAEEALSRPTLTVAHVETLAQGAHDRQLTGIEVRALERRVDLQPDDINARLRLADALRRSGRFVDAETIYRDVLLLTGHPSR